ncbi:hypothetical protein HZS_7837 [Henneguya salminicola]|nr:hypothetical protein HZS_7837 [Henneguya salminicola]
MSHPLYFQNKNINLSRIVRMQQPIYVDVMVALTMEQLKKMGRDKKKYLSQVFKEASIIYGHHNIKLSVRRIRAWNSTNSPHIKDIYDLTSYAKYFSNMSPKFDALIVLEDFTGTTHAGWSSIGQVCTNNAVGISEIGGIFNFDAKDVGEVFAHELAHVLGFVHSDEYSNIIL